MFGIEPSIISTPIGGAKCYGVDFMLGSDVPDPGMVNEGTKCGDNKVRRRGEGGKETCREEKERRQDGEGARREREEE